MNSKITKQTQETTLNREADKSDSQHDRIRVPPGNPFVRESSRLIAHRAARKKPSRIKNRLRQSELEESVRLQKHRKQSYFIGGMFAVLAFLLFFGTRIASPSLIVKLEGGTGTVLIDGKKAGRTNEKLTRLSVGYHIIEVISENPGIVVVPQKREVELKFSLIPRSITFRTVPWQEFQDSLQLKESDNQ